MPIDPTGPRAPRPLTSPSTVKPAQTPAPAAAASARTPAASDAFRSGGPAAPTVLAAAEKYAPVPVELAIKESIAIRGTGAELPTAEEIATLKAQGKDVVFSNLALNEAHALGDKADEFATREQVQGVVLSIDSYQTQDLDNAMSFRREPDGTTVIGIHAVDLAEWVKLGGALDFAARRRVDTRYLEAQGLVLPMLPLSLSEGKLSLFENEPRLTRSVEMRFSATGELVGSRIFRSQLVNRFRLDDTDAAAAAKGEKRGATNPELKDALATMARVAAKASGATDPNATMAMDKMLGFFTQTSTKLVGEALANAELEASFRNQAVPNTRSSYGSEALGHAAIGAKAYAQWTGPMRRYADLDVHRAMDRLIDGKKPQGRKLELDARMRDLQLDRANKVTADPRMDFVKDLVAVTRDDDQ
ncbi:MAG: rnr [Myxococcaceae bacterium]|nr:rnr [Myxococcaceae bacterium]